MIRLQEEMKEFMTCHWGRWGSFCRGPLLDSPSAELTLLWASLLLETIAYLCSYFSIKMSQCLFPVGTFERRKGGGLKQHWTLQKPGHLILHSALSHLMHVTVAAALEGARWQGCHGLILSTLMSLFGFFRTNKAQGTEDGHHPQFGLLNL